MELKRENHSDIAGSFLEMDVAMEDNQFQSNLYDKRNAFKFSVVRLPYRCSNIPSKMFYATISAEVLRIARATSKYTYFLQRVHSLFIRMKKQGADVFGIKKVLRKMISRHADNFVKFIKSTEEVIYDCCQI